MDAASQETSRFLCPACTAPLETTGADFACPSCSRVFPSLAGIPDLRLGYPDPYVSLEEDRERALDLAAVADGLDLEALLAEHWRASGYPESLAQRFLGLERSAVIRAAAYLDAIERERGRPLDAGDALLEVGCGTAAVAATAAGRVGRAVATDLSIRWMVLAQKRLAEAGAGAVELACCSAEELPFPAGTFDVVVAADVIEHVADQRDFVAACHSVLRPGGMLFLATPNRLSLGLEPHVRVWGVGFLPRRLAPRYVRAVSGRRYDHVRLLSALGLRRLLSAAGFETTIVPPEIPPSIERLYRGLELRLVRAYNVARRFGVARQSLLAVGPFFHVFATRRS